LLKPPDYISFSQCAYVEPPCCSIWFIFIICYFASILPSNQVVVRVTAHAGPEQRIPRPLFRWIIPVVLISVLFVVLDVLTLLFQYNTKAIR